MLQNVELILTFFLIFYILILIFDFATILLNKISKRLNKRRRKHLLNIIKSDNEFLLTGILSDIKYLYVLNQLIDEKYKVDRVSIINYLNNKEDVINKLSKHYYKSGDLARSYYSYTLSKISLPKESEDFIFHMLTTKSVYCVENSLKVLYNTGNVDLVIKAYEILSKNKSMYHSKLITDGMMEFKGDKKLLAQELYKDFSNFSTECKIGFINYFRNIKYNIGDDLVSKLEKNSYNKELEISIIRYFTKVKNAKAYKLFVQRLEEDYYEDAEYDIVMIQALANSKNKKTIEILTQKLEDNNYYIRYNACVSLSKITDITKIKTSDEYAKDMIKYVVDLRR